MITVRPELLYKDLKGFVPSKNKVEAMMKFRRFFKRSSRLMPTLLRLQDMNVEISPEDANRNFMNYFRFYFHWEDPAMLDNLLMKGYEIVFDCLYLYSDSTHFRPYVIPRPA